MHSCDNKKDKATVAISKGHYPAMDYCEFLIQLFILTDKTHTEMNWNGKYKLYNYVCMSVFNSVAWYFMSLV